MFKKYNVAPVDGYLIPLFLSANMLKQLFLVKKK